jgi:putative addiction module component (TIGR02574 family)
MNERVKKISEQIRQLSPEEQADLLDEMLAHQIPAPEIEKAWTEEAERRLRALEQGETQAEPLEDVMARLKARIPKSP